MELWRSNGTTAGTTLVKNINPASGGSSIPTGFTAMGNFIYFSAMSSIDQGFELWRSDGTSGGTTLVKDIDTSLMSSAMPQEFTVCRNLLFFTAESGDPSVSQTRQRELYVSNGTAAGTFMVKDIGGADISSDVHSLSACNNKVYFAANDGTSGEELWVSDGTLAGTVMIKNLSPLDGSSYPESLTPFDGKLFFTASQDAGFNPEIHYTDGTSAGTGMLYDFENDGMPDSRPRHLCAVGTNLFFTAKRHNQTTDFSEGWELYKTTGSGVTLVKDIDPNNTQNAEEAGCNPSFFTAIENRLYFVADDGTHGYELWTSNGTAAGTRMVMDINAGSPDGIPMSAGHFSLLQAGEYLYFNAVDGSHGNEIWVLNPSRNAVPTPLFTAYE